jgi:23S rRNA (cytosine1962-C5)-methyltransferase
MTPVIKIKKGREHFLLRGHPWVFAESLLESPNLPAGAVVEVHDSNDHFLAMAFYNQHSSIMLRVLTRNRIQIDQAWFKEQLIASIARRDKWKKDDHEIQRWVAFEGDGIPGLIVDRYGDYFIFQILSAGTENFRETILQTLSEYGPLGIIERSDEKVREKEGLEERKEICCGQLPPKDWRAKEHGISYTIDLWQGHKTGFYIDQATNRQKICSLGAEGGKVLNCFSYTGGFTLNALKGGAHSVTSVDTSLPALEILEENLQENGFDPEKNEQIQGDVFEVLKSFSGQSFHGVILDPPKFASRKQHVKNALKGYRELNVLGMKLVSVGGWLATFTCSGRISREEFQHAVEEAALKAGQVYVIEDVLTQSEDHSVRLGFSDSLYLKGLLLRRVE